MIEASAPGKLVLTGEYAVLVGAPALVAAVDRRVQCRLSLNDHDDWTFRSLGFDAASRHTLEQLIEDPCPAGDPAELAWHVLQYLRPANLPTHMTIEIDSSECYQDGAKLGLGSSAATVVALAAALGKLAGQRLTLSDMLSIHHASQGGSGSGLDVATAYHGNVIRFVRGDEGTAAQVSAVELPKAVHWRFVYAGFSTKTSVMLGKFDAWRERHPDAGGTPTHPPALQDLTEHATDVAEACDSADGFMKALGTYIDCLVRLDDAAGLGIFPDEQREARSLAESSGVLYKPCGAGGGDMGVAVALDGNRLAEFGERVEHAGFRVVPMEITRDGVRVSGD